MISLRRYQESDAQAVGRLIADTYSDYNLSFLPVGERGPYLGPFRNAWSEDLQHRQEIAGTIQADILLVAEDGGTIVGVLRGKKDRLQSLFVTAAYHRQGIGRRLVARFEAICRELGAADITVSASLYAVPFYLRLGYVKDNGIEVGHSFEGAGFKTQPMRKHLS